MAGMPSNDHSPWLGRMLVPSMTASHCNEIPTVGFNHFNDFTVVTIHPVDVI